MPDCEKRWIEGDVWFIAWETEQTDRDRLIYYYPGQKFKSGYVGLDDVVIFTDEPDKVYICYKTNDDKVYYESIKDYYEE